jgi:NhaP-type Na+/H+ or K+/H+ antiporter
MFRIVALDALFFLTPFAAYALWLLVTRRTMRDPNDWTVKTIAWLALAGAVFMVAILVVFIQLDPSPPGGTYVPPRFEDGVIIPGHIEPAT